jgi:hypothetical protein
MSLLVEFLMPAVFLTRPPDLIAIDLSGRKEPLGTLHPVVVRLRERVARGPHMAGQRFASPAAKGGIRTGGDPRRWGTFVGWMLAAVVTGAALGAANALPTARTFERTSKMPRCFAAASTRSASR